MKKSVKNIFLCFSCLLFAVTTYAVELTGTWTGTEDTGEPYTFVFSETDWSMTHDGDGDWQQGTYTTNDNASPKQLDLYITGSSDNQSIAEIALFIYKIEGNTLTLTGSEPGDSYRPSEFSEGGASRTFMVTNEEMDKDETPDSKENSDDDDNVKVYVNCFVGAVQD